MTSNDPDPRAFETWEDAFQYPIPAVRKFEQQLRQHAEENRQKLRNLVGYVFASSLLFLTNNYRCSLSYRDLLGTAERIIDMDKQIQQVEATLGEAGQQCNSRAVEKLFSNYSNYCHDAASRSESPCFELETVRADFVQKGISSGWHPNWHSFKHVPPSSHASCGTVTPPSYPLRSWCFRVSLTRHFHNERILHH